MEFGNFLENEKGYQVELTLIRELYEIPETDENEKTKTSMWNMVSPVIVTGLIIRTIDSHQWRLVVPDLLTLQDSETKMHMSSKHWLGALVLVKIQTIHTKTILTPI